MPIPLLNSSVDADGDPTYTHPSLPEWVVTLSEHSDLRQAEHAAAANPRAVAILRWITRTNRERYLVKGWEYSHWYERKNGVRPRYRPEPRSGNVVRGLRKSWVVYDRRERRAIEHFHGKYAEAEAFKSANTHNAIAIHEGRDPRRRGRGRTQMR